MNQPPHVPAPLPGDATRLRSFLRLAGPFFAPGGGRRARLTAAALLALTMLQIAIQVRFNVWNRDFFDALERRDDDAFLRQMGVFALLAGMSMAVMIYQLYVKQLLQLSWREWLTQKLVAAWLKDARHYQLTYVLDEGADNPDQRIAEDARLATELAVEFAVGMLNAALMLVIFIGVLWGLSGTLRFVLAGQAVAIPGYMVWAALAYALLGSGLTWKLGGPLVGLNMRRTGAEADFRFALTRLRENSEAIALIRGEPDEAQGLVGAFQRVALAVKGVMRGQRRLMWLTTGYGMFGMVFPTLIASPQYFAGVVTLGGLMQIAGAFQQVQIALSWVVDNMGRIAEWQSSVARLLGLHAAIASLDELVADPNEPTLTITEGDGSRLAFRHVRIAYSDGTVVIADASAEILPGEGVLIDGESGAGKSTLMRTIAGVWPWGLGEIVLPPRDTMMFMPQRPYLPLGTLRAALAYPAPPVAFTEAALADALERTCLAELTPRLDEAARWDKLLSLAEQQRLAFARLLLHRPRYVFMDDATSGLNDAELLRMMDLFRAELPEAALISTGTRPGLERWHERTLKLTSDAAGARLELRRRTPPGPPPGLLARLLAALRG
jgi:vitamin B12/bleomycin/antimicrobial peptide transport system ATP-binding/permease protein